MGKGGPLAFLNKKTWHPGRVQNQEEVWKRQQAAAAEDAKVAELKKHLVEEREREEMAALAQSAGLGPRSERLDWMYQGGLQARQQAEARNQGPAGSHAPSFVPQGEAGQAQDPSAASQSASPPAAGPGALSLYAEDTPASANETWQRLHGDPLFAIKQQELAARQALLANPLRLAALRREAQGGGPERREEREQDDGRSARGGSKGQGRSDSGERGSHRERRSDGRDGVGSRRDQSRDRARHGEREPSKGARRRSRSPARRSRDPRNVEDSRERRGSRREDSRDRRGSPHLSYRGGSNDRRPFRRQESSIRGTVRARDAASAQATDVPYGLSLGRVPDGDDVQAARDRADATQRHLEAAARRAKESEEAAAVAAQARRRQAAFQPGRLSDEERQQRLEAMASDAGALDQERAHRHHRARLEEAAQEQQAREYNRARGSRTQAQ